MPRTIEANEHALKDVFCDTYTFEVPGYQRPYSWTAEHATILVDDLLAHMDEQKGDLENCEPYFLGSIVLIKTTNVPKSEVVDGQQRLTTLTILFSALRELRAELCDEVNALQKWIFQLGDPDVGTEDKPRLQLRSRDQDFFNAHIQEASGFKQLIQNQNKLSDSRHNIRENARAMYDRLKLEDKETLKKLSKFMLLSCYLVVVKTPDIDSAFRIFSVLNDRGLDLDTADIIKAKVIGSVPKPKEKSYNDKWEDLEEKLGREEFNNLLTHIRMVERRRKLTQAVLKDYKDHIKPENNPVKFIDNTLTPYSGAYARILYDGLQDFESDAWPDPEKHLRWLKRIDNMDWIPPALFYMTKYDGNPDQILDFLGKLERLASVMMILRYDINKRINRYKEVFLSIDRTKEFATDSALELTDEEKEGARERLNGPVYQTVRTRMPILLRLDTVLAERGATYNHSLITIEHVMPQTPPDGSVWQTQCPDEEQYEGLVHLLGNLVLLSHSKNSAAKNYDFETKKKTYFFKKGRPPFLLTQGVADVKEWTPDVIRERQENFVEALATEWDLN